MATNYYKLEKERNESIKEFSCFEKNECSDNTDNNKTINKTTNNNK